MPAKPPDPSPADNRQALLAELDQLARVVRSRAAEMDRSGNGEVLAVTRLFRNLPLTEWQLLAHRYDFTEWIAFTLDQETSPLLGHFQDRVEELLARAELDPLTGLPNRRVFERAADLELGRAASTGGQLSLALLDVDGLAALNETHGHTCGDEALACLGRVLRTDLRPSEVAARIAGEEFALLLPGLGINAARLRVERLIGQFTALVFQGRGGLPARASFCAGLTACMGRIRFAPTDMLARADMALRQAKKQGRGRVVASVLPKETAAIKATMVHSDEKRFLFAAGK